MPDVQLHSTKISFDGSMGVGAAAVTENVPTYCEFVYHAVSKVLSPTD